MRGACDCVMGEQMQDEGWEFVGRGGGERKRYRYDGIFRDQGSGGPEEVKREENRMDVTCRAPGERRRVEDRERAVTNRREKGKKNT